MDALWKIALAVVAGVLVALAVFSAFRRAAEVFQKRHGSGVLPVPTKRIVETSGLLGLGITIVAIWIVIVVTTASTVATGTDLFVKGAVPLIALAYFGYQLLGGTLFATTSVALTAERSKADPTVLLVKFSIERGSQWVAEIVRDEIAMHSTQNVWEGDAPKWLSELMPRRQDGLLRMAAGEKSSAEIIVRDVSKDSFYITARVVSHAIYWPAHSESFARVCVPATAPPPAS